MTCIEIPELAIAQKFDAIAAGDCIFRCHQKRFTGTDFNPSRKSDGRFTPLFSLDGKVVPTLYAAESFDAALYETIFRQELSPATILPISTVSEFCVSQITVCRELLLVKLFTPELRRWNIDESELLSPRADSYDACRVLAASIWRDNPRACGMVWRSRQDSESNSYLLFGDRCKGTDLAIQETRSANTDTEYLNHIAEAALRAGIKVTG